MLRTDTYRVNTQTHLRFPLSVCLTDVCLLSRCLLFTSEHSLQFLRITVCVYLPFVVSTKLRPHLWRRGSWSERFVVEAGVWCWHMPVWVWVCLFTSNVRLGVDGAAYVWEDKSRKGKGMRLEITFFSLTSIACDWVYQAKPQLPDFLTLICVFISQQYRVILESCYVK